MRVAVLASGSRGNATLVEAGDTRILIDAGIGPRTIRRRAAAAGCVLAALDGIVITHGHADHCAYAARTSRAFSAPLYATEATQRSLLIRHASGIRLFGCRAPFRIGSVTIAPLPVPHDCPQVALVLEHAGERLGLVTDLGTVPATLVEHLSGCDTLLIESNHDAGMLANGPYSPALRARIASDLGHLSNAQTASLLTRLSPSARTVVLMHLSEKNNTPKVALESARRALGRRQAHLQVAHQDTPLLVRHHPQMQLSLSI